MEFRIEHIAGKTCRIWTCGHDGSVIYWGTARRDDNEETAVAELLKEMTKGKSWTLVAYEVEHWNQDFSPWAVPSVFGQEDSCKNSYRYAYAPSFSTKNAESAWCSRIY